MVMQALVVLHTVWLRAVLFGAFWFGVSYVNLRQPHILSAKIKENPSSCIQVNTVCFILIYIQQDATVHNLFCLETALHFSGGTTTYHQECKQLYLQHLVFVTPLLLPAAVTV